MSSNPHVMKVLMLTTDELTDLELAVLNIVVQTDGDPHDKVFDFDKVKSLFTENGKAHDEIKDALASIVNQRLA